MFALGGSHHSSNFTVDATFLSAGIKYLKKIDTYRKILHHKRKLNVKVAQDFQKLFLVTAFEDTV